MLISLKFKNFLSYKDETQLLMTSVKAFKELKETNVFKARKFELLKTAVVYGPNGGGKSNLIKAMGFMTHVIHNSFADSLKKKEDQFDYDLQFILNSESEKRKESILSKSFWIVSSFVSPDSVSDTNFEGFFPFLFHSII